MNCQDARPLLHALTDRELNLLHHVEVERHLTTCQECSAASRRISEVRSLFQQDGLYHQAPAGLRRKLKQQQAAPRARILRPFSGPWLGPALGLAALVMFVLGQQFISLRAENTLADELVDDHVRSLMVSHLTDVTATDQQTVKPWFEGKLDFAPPVKDPAGQGFPLRGCRLDYLDRRPVAVCVYQRRGHWINLFIMPAEKVREATPQPSTHRGFNILTWASAGMSFYAVSDLSSAELNDFGFAFSKL